MRDICTRQKYLADEVISFGLSMNRGWELGRGIKGPLRYIVEETYNFTSMFHSKTFTIIIFTIKFMAQELYSFLLLLYIVLFRNFTTFGNASGDTVTRHRLI